VVDAVGGPADVHAYSGGALLALHSAAAGIPIRRMTLLEPPLHDADHDFTKPDPLTSELEELIGRDQRDAAVLHFHRSIGVPEELLESIRGTIAWTEMCSVAHTLIYNCRISAATTPELLAAVEVPALVLDSTGSTEDLSGWAATAAARLPDAQHRTLAGEWHTVPEEVLAPVLVEFFQRGE
jgi:hypothetical protein